MSRRLLTDCLKCGYVISDPNSNYCKECLIIFEERATQQGKWAEYHDEPCSEVELTQFPRSKIMSNGIDEARERMHEEEPDFSPEPLCKVCFLHRSECVCPECPQCGETGKISCYKDHTLMLGKDQLALRTQKRIEDLEEELATERSYLTELENWPDSYCEEWREAS